MKLKFSNVRIIKYMVKILCVEEVQVMTNLFANQEVSELYAMTAIYFLYTVSKVTIKILSVNALYVR